MDLKHFKVGEIVMMKRFTYGFLCAGFLLAAGCGGDAGEPAPAMDETMDETMAETSLAAPEVRFSEPADGAEVVGPDVQVAMEVSGLEVVEAGVFEEGTGHHHVFVNEDVTPMGQVIPANIPGVVHMGDGSSELVLEDLEPGEYRLIAVVGDGAHIPLDPPVMDTIFITVVAPE